MERRAGERRPLEVVVLIGLQASGKTTFYERYLAGTHVRISLDALRTRARERRALRAALEAGRSVVVDNTNPTKAERRRYVEIARAFHARVRGYYFQSTLARCLERNRRRPRPVPAVALYVTHRRLELPSYEEGFDELFYVWLDERGEFHVEPWRGERRNGSSPSDDSVHA
ncbi:MAG TPA: AAA family ATPase [Chloroflexota bacterium]